MDSIEILKAFKKIKQNAVDPNLNTEELIDQTVKLWNTVNKDNYNSLECCDDEVSKCIKATNPDFNEVECCDTTEIEYLQTEDVDLAEVERSLQDIDMRIRELTAENAVLTNEITECLADKDRTVNELATVRQKTSTKINNLTRQLDVEKAKTAALQTELDECKKKPEAGEISRPLEERINALTAQLDASTQQITQLESDLDVSRDRIKELEQRPTEFQLRESEKRRQIAEENYNTLIKVDRITNRKNVRLQSTIIGLKSDLASAKRDLDDCRAQLRQSGERITGIDTQIAKCRTDLAAKSEEVLRAGDEKTKAARETLDQLNKLRTEKAALSEKVKALNRNKENLTSRIATLNTQLQACKAKPGAAQITKPLEDRIKQIEEERTRERDQLERQVGELEKRPTQDRLDAVNEALVEANTRIAELQEQLRTAQGKQGDDEAQMRDCQTQLDRNREEIANLNQQIRELEKRPEACEDTETLHERIRTLTQENNRLRGQWNTCNENRQTSIDQVTNLEGQIQQLNRDTERITAEKDELQQNLEREVASKARELARVRAEEKAKAKDTIAKEKAKLDKLKEELEAKMQKALDDLRREREARLEGDPALKSCLAEYKKNYKNLYDAVMEFGKNYLRLLQHSATLFHGIEIAVEAMRTNKWGNTDWWTFIRHLETVVLVNLFKSGFGGWFRQITETETTKSHTTISEVINKEPENFLKYYTANNRFFWWWVNKSGTKEFSFRKGWFDDETKVSYNLDEVFSIDQLITNPSPFAHDYTWPEHVYELNANYPAWSLVGFRTIGTTNVINRLIKDDPDKDKYETDEAKKEWLKKNRPVIDAKSPEELEHCVPGDARIVEFEVAPEAERAPIREVAVEETDEYKALLARVRELEGRVSCKYLDWADYTGAGDNTLSIDDWQAKYNINNQWTLTKEEFEDLILIIPYLYFKRKYSALRKVVEKCIERRTAFSYDSGTNITGNTLQHMSNLTKKHIQYYRYEAQGFFQAIRVSWTTLSKNNSFAAAFNALVTFGNMFTSDPAMLKNERQFRELGKITQIFWETVLPRNISWLYEDLE